MCDTILAPPQTTDERVMLFGKNSDRQRNEAQAVELISRSSHAPGASVMCTYVAIPQARETYAILMCRPFWLWGAEMGANEHGVAIGNEGLHARVPAPEANALTGMDLLRLALERAASAAEAVEVITDLLMRHGQGGNCGHIVPSYYHNGFMIADSREAFVLETVNRDWLVERVGGVRAISNRYTIAREVHQVSAGLQLLVQALGNDGRRELGYADVLAAPNREHIGNAGARHACSMSLLDAKKGRLSVGDMMDILRSHGLGETREPHPAWSSEYSLKRTVCMHAGADEANGQTVGSIACELREGRPVHWVTGTASPCISIFKPLFMDVPLPACGPPLTDRYDPQTLWWRHERLHRASLRGGFGEFLEHIRPERDALEAGFRTRVRDVLGADEGTRARTVSECWQAAAELEQRWYARIAASPSTDSDAYLATWDEASRLAGMA